MEPNFADQGLMWTHKPQMMIGKKEQCQIMQITQGDLDPNEAGPIDIIKRQVDAATWCAVNEKDQM